MLYGASVSGGNGQGPEYLEKQVEVKFPSSQCPSPALKWLGMQARIPTSSLPGYQRLWPSDRPTELQFADL